VSPLQSAPREDEFAGVGRLGDDFVIGFDRTIRTRIEECGFMAGTVNPTTHDRVSDGGEMERTLVGSVLRICAVGTVAVERAAIVMQAVRATGRV
jgi:hypothetical protein